MYGIKSLFLACLSLGCFAALNAQTQIIAHRGYWDKMGSAQNSISSLRNAVEMGVYGSELDVWMAKDGTLPINHGENYNGVNVEETSYEQLATLQLSNGEYMPVLKQCLNVIRDQQKTRLIVEIKSHETSKPKSAELLDYEKRTAAAVVKQVNECGLADMIDYISFSENICEELIRISPHHRVAYLGGDKSPKELKAAGYWGLDYYHGTLKNHPEWIMQAHELGLTVNVWTVNKVEDMLFFIEHNVDFITTDNPQLLLGLLLTYGSSIYGIPVH
jgi:glycerophosphoryl diester phosphodiesterase